MALPFIMDQNMTTKNPIATVSFLRKWQLIHRRLVGSTPRRRHVYLARTLALTGMTPTQTAVVTAHLARVDQAFCCDYVADYVAAGLRPALFADAVLKAIGEGKPTIVQNSTLAFSVRCFDNHSKLRGYSVAAKDKKKLIEAEAVLIRRADGKTTAPSRKKRNP
jgi:hypothetical protein